MITEINPILMNIGSFTFLFFRHVDAWRNHLLHNLWIGDTGTDAHIINAIMFDCFVEFCSANGIDCIISGTCMLIVGYGKLHVNVTQNGEHQTIKLFNVVYIPDYLTNLVSINLVKCKEMYFNNQQMMLYIENNKLFCDIKTYNAHYLIENNTKNPPSESLNLLTNFIIKQTIEADWHSILRHASAEAIQHLETSIEEVKIL